MIIRMNTLTTIQTTHPSMDIATTRTTLMARLMDIMDITDITDITDMDMLALMVTRINTMDQGTNGQVKTTSRCPACKWLSHCNEHPVGGRISVATDVQPRDRGEDS